ncbi:MAG: hypothetical protein ACFFDT_05980 [Candidatus Hodarchaeota archaeon]
MERTFVIKRVEKTIIGEKIEMHKAIKLAIIGIIVSSVCLSIFSTTQAIMSAEFPDWSTYSIIPKAQANFEEKGTWTWTPSNVVEISGTGEGYGDGILQEKCFLVESDASVQEVDISRRINFDLFREAEGTQFAVSIMFTRLADSTPAEQLGGLKLGVVWYYSDTGDGLLVEEDWSAEMLIANSMNIDEWQILNQIFVFNSADEASLKYLNLIIRLTGVPSYPIKARIDTLTVASSEGLVSYGVDTSNGMISTYYAPSERKYQSALNLKNLENLGGQGDWEQAKLTLSMLYDTGKKYCAADYGLPCEGDEDYFQWAIKEIYVNCTLKGADADYFNFLGPISDENGENDIRVSTPYACAIEDMWEERHGASRLDRATMACCHEAIDKGQGYIEDKVQDGLKKVVGKIPGGWALAIGGYMAYTFAAEWFEPYEYQAFPYQDRSAPDPSSTEKHLNRKVEFETEIGSDTVYMRQAAASMPIWIEFKEDVTLEVEVGTIWQLWHINYFYYTPIWSKVEFPSPHEYEGIVTQSHTYEVNLKEFEETPTSTRDTDIDGITDYNEIYYSYTDPLTSDCDQDGLLDGEEHYATYGYQTHPWNPDSDFDGITDDWEITYSLDPLIDDANEDPDGDGWNNYEEQQHGWDPWKYDPTGSTYVQTNFVESGWSDPDIASGTTETDEDGIAWKAINGDWLVHSGNYLTQDNAPATGPSIIVAGNDVSNVIVEARVRTVNAYGWCGIVIRHQSGTYNGNWIGLMIWTYPGISHGGRVGLGTYGGTYLKFWNQEITLGTWYTLRVVAIGNQYDCYIDGRFLGSVTDPSNSVPTGKSGLMTVQGSSQSRFDDFASETVWPPRSPYIQTNFVESGWSDPDIASGTTETDEDGIAWKAINGDWLVHSGNYLTQDNAPATGPSIIVAGNDVSNVIVEARVRTVNAYGWCGIVIRHQSGTYNGNWIGLMIWTYPGISHGGRVGLGTYGGTYLKFWNQEITLGTWYTLRVVAIGNQYDCYIDGRFLGSVTDPSNSVPTGKSGLMTVQGSSQSRFDDFVSKTVWPRGNLYIQTNFADTLWSDPDIASGTTGTDEDEISWEAINGDWYVHSGDYLAQDTRSAGVMSLIVAGNDVSNVIVEAKVRTVNAYGWCGIVIRHQSGTYNGNWIGLMINTWPDNPYGGRVSLGTYGGTYLAHWGQPITLGTWYTLRVVAIGNQYDCYIDGRFLGSVTDPSNSVLTGRSGLMTVQSDSQSRFDDFVSIHI